MKSFQKKYFPIIIFIIIFQFSGLRAADKYTGDIIKIKIAELDTLFESGIDGYQNRLDISDIEKSMILSIDAAKGNPYNYEFLWRAARSTGYYTECAVGLQIAGWKEACLKWGRIGEDYSLRAQKIEPSRVEARFWQIFCISGYSRAISVITAISERIHIKLEECMLRAYKTDRSYFDYFPVVSLAMYYYSLPWPLCDREKAFKYLNEFLSNAKSQFQFKTRSVDIAEIMISTNKPELVSKGKEIIRKSAANPKLPKHYRDKAIRLKDDIE